MELAVQRPRPAATDLERDPSGRAARRRAAASLSVIMYKHLFYYTTRYENIYTLNILKVIQVY